MPNFKPNQIGMHLLSSERRSYGEETFEGETLDVSPFGVWFDGRGHKAGQNQS